MKKIFILIFFILIMSNNNIVNACDKNKVTQVIKEIIDNGIATRVDNAITIHYTWNNTWFNMNEGQQYDLVKALAGAEYCLRQNVTVRIKAAGRDVARATTYDGNIEIYK